MNTDWIRLRQDRVYEYIKSRHMTTIDEISTALKISSSTVRRDAKQLEKENKILLFHGGVSANEEYETFTIRKSRRAEEKRRIGQRAAELVRSGDMIYMGGGSTVFETALALSQRVDISNLTVVTSAMNIAACFENNGNVKVIVPGGIFVSSEESMTSKMTIDALRLFNFTKVIVGMIGITAKQGCTFPSLELCEMKRMLFRQGKEVIVVSDHTKFGKIGPYGACPVADIDTLVTDEGGCDREDAEAVFAECPNVILV